MVAFRRQKIPLQGCSLAHIVRSMKALLALLACALLTGCYSSKFIPYSGAQQIWPTSPGSFVDTNRAVPVYYGQPPRPYTYLGQISVTTQSQIVDVVAAAATVAKEHGANALLVIEESERPIGSVGSGFGSAMPAGRGAIGSGFGSSAIAYGGVTKCIAIRLQPAVP